jgi:hypothetical protein
MVQELIKYKGLMVINQQKYVCYYTILYIYIPT